MNELERDKIRRKVQEDLGLYSACISGASYIKYLEQYMNLAGFKDIKITPKEQSKEFIKKWTPDFNVQDFIVSANIEATK